MMAFFRCMLPNSSYWRGWLRLRLTKFALQATKDEARIPPWERTKKLPGSDQNGWGLPPWKLPPQHAPLSLPVQTDFAVVGGGFTGLSAAAWLKRLAPDKSVLLLESDRIGAGASGRTGGMALAESAAGDLPGLGDVLAGLAETLREFNIDCDFSTPGAWELGRQDGREDSPISWVDSGELRVVNEVPGGTIDPGELLQGLDRALQTQGVLVAEGKSVERVRWSDPLSIKVGNREIQAKHVLIATNAQSLELSELQEAAESKLTLAVATSPLPASSLASVGLTSGRPFYTVDLPYLWGRSLGQDRMIFGSGLVSVEDWRELRNLDVSSGETSQVIQTLKYRVSRLHPVLQNVEFTHAWGGPILFTDGARPIFERHPKSEKVIVLAGYNGHGVALSVHLGRWAAEALLGRKTLPDWGRHH